MACTFKLRKVSTEPPVIAKHGSPSTRFFPRATTANQPIVFLTATRVFRVLLVFKPYIDKRDALRIYRVATALMQRRVRFSVKNDGWLRGRRSKITLPRNTYHIGNKNVFKRYRLDYSLH